MRALYLLRHSLTEANERRLYCGRTDLPLSPAGRELARNMARERPLPPFDLCAASGMARAVETLQLLTGRAPDAVLPALSEMDFGRFEMHSYDELKLDADYLAWIGDESGGTACPGGESASGFRRRVLNGGAQMLEMRWETALLVCHGGVVVNLMQHWFPDERRGFYDWQPAACRGWRASFNGTTPVGFEPV